MNSCYLCAREMIDKEFYLKNKYKFPEKPVFKHQEHIIQNTLRGKLKSESILCKNCGDKLNKDIDSNFTDLFALITELLGEKLARKDHGKTNSSKTLKGHLFLDEKLQNKISINFKDFQVSPETPYYKIDEQNKTVRIYANKTRLKQYKPIVIRELQEKGYDIEIYKIEDITNIYDEGILSLCFSENVENFNEKFLLGLNKIATGFAYYNGIKRKDLTRSLNLTKGQENIIYSKNVIPFIPLGCFDRLLELNRPEIETNYPTHTLILFTQENTINNQKVLYCYIDLFSTFQYYVILNDNYKGKNIYKIYHQTVLRQEIPDLDIRKISPKYLNLIIEEWGIDRSKYKGNSINELYDFVQQEYKRLKITYELNIEEELESIASRLINLFAYSQYSKISDSSLKNIGDGFNLNNNEIPSFLLEVKPYLEKDSYMFRRCFCENNGNNGIEILSTPDEIMSELQSSDSNSIIREYGHLKFQQLSTFIKLNHTAKIEENHAKLRSKK